MGQKPHLLSKNEVPEHLHPFLDFNAQQSRKVGKNRLLCIKATCATCGKEFWKTAISLRQRRKKSKFKIYCSSSCQNAEKVRPLKPSDIPASERDFFVFDRQVIRNKRDGLEISITCRLCGRNFWRLVTRIRKNGVNKALCCNCYCAKPLREEEILPEFADFIFPDKNRYFQDKKGKNLLHTLVKCQDCGETFWKGTTILRREHLQKQKRIRCSGCAKFKKPSRFIDKDGYVQVRISSLPTHQQLLARKMTKGSHIFEHRLKMALYLGRPLKRSELVHHRNGNKADNRLANLRLVTLGTHCKAPADEIAKVIVEIEDRARSSLTKNLDPLPLLRRFLSEISSFSAQQPFLLGLEAPRLTEPNRNSLPATTATRTASAS